MVVWGLARLGGALCWAVSCTTRQAQLGAEWERQPVSVRALRGAACAVAAGAQLMRTAVLGEVRGAG